MADLNKTAAQINIALDFALDAPNRGIINFIKRLNAGTITKIKIIGDSIAEGAGATGHVSPPVSPQPIIFDNGAGITHREGGYTEPSWANHFRNYLTACYPGITFTNCGIAGASALWTNTNKAFLINAEDVVFVELGTNDRVYQSNIAGYIADMTSLLAYISAHCSLMIVMSPPPAMTDFTDDTGTVNQPAFPFGIKEIDLALTELCRNKGYIHFSLYREMLKFAQTSKTGILSFVQGALIGSHPVDLGHKTIWQIIEQNLGIIDNTMKWDTPALVSNQQNYIVDAVVLNSTLITNAIFNVLGAIYYQEIGGTNPELASFPEGATGLLTTYKGKINDLYAYQEYRLRQSNTVYKRFWVYNTAWGDWVKVGSKPKIDSTTITNSTAIALFPAGVISYSEIPTTHADIANFPAGARGTLETHRFTTDSYGYQLYNVFQSINVYKRYSTGAGWSAWTKINV